MTNGDGTPTAAALQQAYPSIPYPGIGKLEECMSHRLPRDVRWFALCVYYISGFVSLCWPSVGRFARLAQLRSEGPFSQGRRDARALWRHCGDGGGKLPACRTASFSVTSADGPEKCRCFLWPTHGPRCLTCLPGQLIAASFGSSRRPRRLRAQSHAFVSHRSFLTAAASGFAYLLLFHSK